METKSRPGFSLEAQLLKFKGRLCVPNVPEIKGKVLEEAHKSRFAMHLGNTKMYQDLKQAFWWSNMKREITEFISRLIKSAHFLQVKTIYNADRLVTVYIAEIIRLHGVPISIVLDRDSGLVCRQKSYEDQRRRDLEFEVGDHVFVKVTPMKGHTKFGKKGKLSPRYIGPFQILERLDPVVYRIALPPGMEQVHNVFHISMLQSYLRDPSHVINYHQIKLDDNMGYEEQPI
ncbi:uncharacterized protein LOC114287105 [Camellia sinensis]|uniref:uncharacterized protein LOC114287105 n=1 Tax=Camellia sinensis TaxID=4442 RepID=UPI00103646CC|nr:uncharacterized protein LOC114287105 [Camellia sinensis]